jgi:hypothetical protein
LSKIKSLLSDLYCFANRGFGAYLHYISIKSVQVIFAWMIIIKNHSGLLSANPLPWQERAIAFGVMPQPIACSIELSNNGNPLK